MGVRTPRWEAELWSYISRGDGVCCPLHGDCRFKQQAGQCLSEHKERVNQLLDDSYFDYNNNAFLGFVTPCKILELVERLAQKYLKMGDINSPPVPAVLIALFDNRRTVEVREVPLRVYHGAIWYLRDSWVVHLNADETSAKKRFTLFHEAFHILAHCGARASPVFRRRGADTGSFNELLAEHFSSCLLMPRNLVEENWAQLQDVGKTAEIFDVPQPAVRIRLKLLGLI